MNIFEISDTFQCIVNQCTALQDILNLFTLNCITYQFRNVIQCKQIVTTFFPSAHVHFYDAYPCFTKFQSFYKLYDMPKRLTHWNIKFNASFTKFNMQHSLSFIHLKTITIDLVFYHQTQTINICILSGLRQLKLFPCLKKLRVHCVFDYRLIHDVIVLPPNIHDFYSDCNVDFIIPLHIRRLTLHHSKTMIVNHTDVFLNLIHFKGIHHDQYDYDRMFPNLQSCSLKYVNSTVDKLCFSSTLNHLTLRGNLKAIETLPHVSSLKIVSSYESIRIAPLSARVQKFELYARRWINCEAYDLSNQQVFYTTCENQLNARFAQLQHLSIRDNSSCKNLCSLCLKSFHCEQVYIGAKFPTAKHITIGTLYQMPRHNMATFFNTITNRCQSLIIHQLNNHRIKFITPQNKSYTFKHLQKYNEIRLNYIPQTFIVEGQIIS